jgi:hypothetical protein
MTTRNHGCRVCAECAGNPHHWLPNPDFGNGGATAGLHRFDYVCKHCPALGDVCQACGGTGMDCSVFCPGCDGVGVVETGCMGQI